MTGKGTSGLGHAFVALDSSGHVWNGTTFEPWNQTLANMSTNYKVAAAELGTSGVFNGTLPAGTAKWYLCTLTTGQLADPISEPLTITDEGDVGSSSDPWAATLPGSYSAGQAGHIVGRALPDVAAGAAGGLWISDDSNNRFIDAATTVTGNVNGHVGSVSGNVNGNVIGSVQGNVDSVANVGNIADAVWEILTSTLTTAGTIGKKLASLVLGSDNKVMISADAGSNPAGSLTITPIQASVTNPRYATRDLAPIAQNSTPTEIWTITDGSNNPVNLTGKIVRMVGYKSAQPDDDPDPFDATLTALWKYETSGGGITIGGTSNNLVSVVQGPASTGTPGHFHYILWNITDGIPLAKGRYPVEPAVMNA